MFQELLMHSSTTRSPSPETKKFSRLTHWLPKQMTDISTTFVADMSHEMMFWRLSRVPKAEWLKKARLELAPGPLPLDLKGESVRHRANFRKISAVSPSECWFNRTLVAS